ncbi:hypothetical protein D6T64_17550 [Cryobacterium melibiosiphilum]|uniref:Uncharacterized protein n=1 Tax=Cryobacterium melibiosiphilum TaxID=995039 RepID=A0A3A5MJF3_9MICO|nr:hypothetical protein [Cryobacterium melibiosiphilum]RJT86933.1 hypothetical protein D6T64_17550 [Cryobacterium melibiosiphilum]
MTPVSPRNAAPRWNAIILSLPRTPLRPSLDAVRAADRVSIVGITRQTVADASPWAAAIASGLHSLREDEAEFTAVVESAYPLLAQHLAGLTEGLSPLPAAGRFALPVALYRTTALRQAHEHLVRT